LPLAKTKKLLEEAGKRGDMTSVRALLANIVSQFYEVVTLLKQGDWMAVIKAG
jgi:hypothetical protein